MTLIGRVLYLLAFPIIYFSVNGTKRTRIVIISDNQVVLVKNWLGDGSYGLPGGGAHKNEPLKAAAIREVKEEVGLSLNEKSLKQIRTFSHYKNFVTTEQTVYVARLKEKLPLKVQKFEIIEASWINLVDIDSLKLEDYLIDILKSLDSF